MVTMVIEASTHALKYWGRLLPLLAMWSLVNGDAAAAAEERPPNVLLIVTDDQGWWDLGVHGNPVLRTPRLDALCGEGVEFTQFYVSPVCSLTRASIMTA